MNAISCKCGLRKQTWGIQLWITSPRTGATLALDDGWWMDLPPRLADRIVSCAAAGLHSLAFTVDELKAFAAVHQKFVKATTPTPQASSIRSGRYARMFGGV